MSDNPAIPVSVVIVTRDAAAQLPACLSVLSRYDQVVVVNSGEDSNARTATQSFGAEYVTWQWNGQYPKKRQWCLNHLDLRHDWVFFVDADEMIPADLTDAVAALFVRGNPDRDGYFVRGRYIWDGRVLRHGLLNNKLMLFDRRKFHFPMVDDLDLPGMGEIEGHYQPVACDPGARAGVLGAMLNHDAASDPGAWRARHERYAAWEAGMNARGAWPADPVQWRQIMKRIFRAMPGRDVIAFFHCYIWKRGFLDGRAGFDFARARGWYYRRIAELSRS